LNRFGVLCPGCGHAMLDAVVDGFSRLIHSGPIMSLGCVSSIRYVRFTSEQGKCNHCCPETFAECQVCHKGAPGKQFCRLD
jgi:hypothetical protein